MEALNDIEKITLLLSTSIVGLINLLVLIERIKKSDKQLSSLIIQKLLGIKNTFLVFCIVVLMSSCSTSKFLNRKYTFGRFTENVKSLKHNTIYVDTTKRYSSSNNQIVLKKSPISLNEISDKEIINKKVGLIIKKDSIFIFKKRGKDIKTVMKNNLPNVTIIVNDGVKTIKQAKIIDYEKIRLKEKAQAVKLYKQCLFLSVVPFVGLVFAKVVKRKVLKYQNEFPDDKEKFNKWKINLAITIGVFTSLLGLVALVYGFFYLFLAHTMTAIY